MSINQEKGEYREFSNEKLAELVKSYRKNRGWTQETLSEISKIQVRTIQRVEAGKGAGLDTKRRLAEAFDLGDIDIFNKPCFVSEEELIQEKIKNEYKTLNVNKIKTASHFHLIYDQAVFHSYVQLVDLPIEAESIFAKIQDYMNDCDGIYSELSVVEILNCHKVTQELLNKLENENYILGVVVGDYEFKEDFPNRNEGEKFRLNYYVVSEKENFPARVVVEKSTNQIKFVLFK